MANSQSNPTIAPFYQERAVSQQSTTWSQRYGDRHRLEWIKNFPPGIAGPKKVRIYQRAGHYILQWWDKSEKCNLCERVNGDLLAALMRARQIDERLEHFRSATGGARKTPHTILLEKFTADLRCRADAGEIDPRTVHRYESALGHYQRFIAQPEISRTFPYISLIDREFSLKLAAYLRSLEISANGHANSPGRPMQRPDYVIDVTRAMFDWAADPHRGKLIPEGFHNPFLRRGRGSSTPADMPVGEPDITVSMAVDFLAACDFCQLRLFGPIVIYGLRAAEPCFLFHEHLGSDWLDVPCLPEVDYFTKGRRSKRLPLIPAIDVLLRSTASDSPSGLLYFRRNAEASGQRNELIGSSYPAMIREFQCRCSAVAASTAVQRRLIRDQLLHDAGGMNYDHIATEFGKVSRRLCWPRSATIKDFRHLAATCLENAGMPELYRRFLLGQSPGRAAIVTYTHLNAIREKFDVAVAGEIYPLVEAIERRTAELRFDASTVRKGLSIQ